MGLLAVVSGGVLLVTNVQNAYAATTLSLTTTAAGASCNNSNPAQPVCSGLAAGDVVAVSGAGFKAGSLGSIEECNADASQPVIYYLGNDIPVSCSPLAITTIGSKGTLAASKTVAGGTVGPPINSASEPPTCTQVTPSTSTITGCMTSGSAATDAANYPCPPTTAQQAAGDTCVLAIGDQAGDRAIGIALFGSETLPTSSTAPTSSSPSSSSTSSSSTSSTSTSSTTSSTTSTTSPTTSSSTSTSTTSTTSPTTSSSTSTSTTSTTSSTTSTTSPTTSSSTSTSTPTSSTTTSQVPASSTTTTPGTPVALTGAYELYCPNAPIVGNVALNDVMTSATITPTSPASGGSFQITGYQTVVTIPTSLATAAAAVSPTLAGTATTSILASGATPATTSVGPTNFSVTIPTNIPAAGVPLSVPSSPETVPQTYTATSANITIQEASAAALNLTIAGQPFPLTCTAYPNNSTTAGLGATAPTASPISPVIAVAGTGSTATTAPPTPTTTPKSGGSGGSGGSGTTAAAAKPVTANSGQLSFTGVGPGVGILGIVGGALILMGLLLLVLVDVPRRVLAQLAFLTPSRWQNGQVSAFLSPDRWASGRAALGRRTLAFVNPIRSKITRERGPRTSRLVNPIRRRQARIDGDAGSSDAAQSPLTAESPLVASASLPPSETETQGAPMTDGWVAAPMPVPRNRRSLGERFAGLPDASRVFGQNALRIAHRAAVWLLGR